MTALDDCPFAIDPHPFQDDDSNGICSTRVIFSFTADRRHLEYSKEVLRRLWNEIAREREAAALGTA